MHILSDQFLKPVAYIYNNIILLPASFEVIGFKLGDCVFSRHSLLIGKYFKSAIYNVEGEILAKDDGESADGDFDPAKVMLDAWKLIKGVKEHMCPWIIPGENWATLRLDKILTDEDFSFSEALPVAQS